MKVVGRYNDFDIKRLWKIQTFIKIFFVSFFVGARPDFLAIMTHAPLSLAVLHYLPRDHVILIGYSLLVISNFKLIHADMGPELLRPVVLNNGHVNKIFIFNKKIILQRK